MIREATSKRCCDSIAEIVSNWQKKKGLHSCSLKVSSFPREPSELDFYLMTWNIIHSSFVGLKWKILESREPSTSNSVTQMKMFKVSSISVGLRWRLKHTDRTDH